MIRFKNRHEAGLLLAIKLKDYKLENAVIMAIPRGGVPLGYAIAKALKLPLEIVFSKKIGHPNHREYAIGAVTLKNRVLSEAAEDISDDYIELETEKIRAKLTENYKNYYGTLKELDLRGKILIVVDDGLATGNTMLSTIQMLHDEKPSKIMVAVPVAPTTVFSKLQNSPFIDELVCLLTPSEFRAVGQFYEDFDQINDEQVKYFLNKARSEF